MKIPIIGLPDTALSATTQERIPIADILHDIVLLKNGGACLVIESSSLNFGLLNELEQQAVIASYAGLLNSFNFPVQIAVRSQRKDISNYMRYLNEQKLLIKNPKLLSLMNDYQRFILDAVKKKNVLSKSFYLIIPFTQFEMGVSKTILPALTGNKKVPFPESYVVKKARVALYPKRDHLIRQARRLGVEFKQLTTPELVGLYYHLFNPEPPHKKREILR